MTEQLSNFSYTIDVNQLSTDPQTYEFVLSSNDRPAMAERLNIPGIEFLKALVTVQKTGDLITVTGHLDAKLDRECVVSLEPMKETISEDIDLQFTEEEPLSEVPYEMEADLEAPEPIEDGQLYLGEALVEQLVLAMSPHPRIEGAVAPEDPGAGARISPFDVLKSLKSES